MRKVLGLVGATLLFAGPALAADVGTPTYKAPPLAPAFSWTGWYIGANAGFGLGQSTDPNVSGDMSMNARRFPNLLPKGFIGGGQIGYDWQVSPNWVFGLVADFQGADISASGLSDFQAGTQHVTESISNKLDFLGTGRMRLGWTSGNWLFYGSGGVAFGNVSSTADLRVTWPGQVYHASGSNSETLDGWAAGAGINYALTWNWIAGVDYLHYDLGRSSVTVAKGCCTNTVSQKVGGDIVRGVVNYKF